MSKRLTLVPAPRLLAMGQGVVNLVSPLVVVCLGNHQELLPTLQGFRQFAAERLGLTVEISASPIGLEKQPHILVDTNYAEISHSQGYQLAIGAGEVTIHAGDAAGAAYGLATLKQIIAIRGRQLPELSITDYPDFGRRGVMLDISRGKVPTMETLYRFVEMLADLKINEFQLYTEHTFAYRQHREVWQNYSPMTGEQILALDAFCHDRFIDLVPNQNSFGHLTQWLIHQRYAHMAEAVDGWDTPWGGHNDEPFSLCPLEPSVPGFLGSLYDELLTHFSSRYFNVGCDETFDLGQGRSKEEVERLGEHRVYMDLLLKIYEMVKGRGKVMQFWGDIIVKAPEYIKELPNDIIALEWGYEANHPFDERCGHFAKAGIPFYVCPGTSTWNTLVGRTDNALGNLKSAAEYGLKHGAIGYLNTIWGDRGHQDYQPVTYLPIAYGAAFSWALESNRTVDAPSYLNEVVFRDRSGKIGQLLYDLGNVYQTVGVTVSNSSIMGRLLHYGLGHARPIPGLNQAGFDRTAAAIKELALVIDQLELGCTDASLVLRELKNAVHMLLHSCELGKL
ncbi:MAG: beta-N-acetylhexosaminidase, partial [Bacillota bacterium]